MTRPTARRIVDIVMIVLLAGLAWWFVSGTPADAGIMSASEADLAQDYSLDVPWWVPQSGGIVDLFWWIRKAGWVIPPVI